MKDWHFARCGILMLQLPSHATYLESHASVCDECLTLRYLIVYSDLQVLHQNNDIREIFVIPLLA